MQKPGLKMDLNEKLLQVLKQDNEENLSDVLTNLLQQKGVSVNYCNYGNYETPLHIAAVRGHSSVIGVLLSHGAHVNAGTADMVTPLHEACLAGHYTCVKMLVDAGAEVNVRNIDGSTPLCYASAKGCRRTIQLLLSAGAKVNLSLATTFPPLHEAVLHGNSQCINDLVEAGAHLDKSENHFGTALHVSCLKDYCKCTKLLLLAGANPDCIRLHHSPLHLSANQGCRRCIMLLVAFGADIYKRDIQERTAMDIVKGAAGKDILEHETVMPRTLLQCCRLGIRRSLGPSKLVRICQLPIPTILKRYIHYAEF